MSKLQINLTQQWLNLAQSSPSLFLLNWAPFLSSVVGASTSPFIGRSVCVSNKCQKSVKNCQKRGFETNNECTSKHQDDDSLLECTSVHTTIKQSFFVLGSCNKEADDINKIHRLVSYEVEYAPTNTTRALDHTYTELSVARATLVSFQAKMSEIWPF